MHQPILDEHRRRNQETRPRWREYTAHRHIVTRLLLEASSSCSSLCLLGAGNCNDLDLVKLTCHYENVHLVDMDEEALAYAKKQIIEESGRLAPRVGIRARGASKPPSFTTSASSRLAVHPTLEASGVADELETWRGSATDEQFVRAIARANQATPCVNGEPYDVVASCCLLSQLIDSVVLTKTESHPRFLDLLFAVRDRHLELLWHWTKPGGSVVLVSDFVSSATFPQLAAMTPAQLSAAFPQLIEQRNFFTCTNPVAIRETLLAFGAAGAVEIVGPWVWPVGARVFAVCAVIAQKPR